MTCSVKRMKKAVTILLAMTLALTICGAALAEEAENDSDVIIVESERGVFTVEELPEYGDIVIPEPTPKPASAAAVWDSVTASVGTGGAAAIIAVIVLAAAAGIAAAVKQKAAQTPAAETGEVSENAGDTEQNETPSASAEENSASPDETEGKQRSGL